MADEKNRKIPPQGLTHTRGRGGKKPLGIYLHHHRHLTRSVAISAGLLVFLAILPSHIRWALFHGLWTHPLWSVMLLGFGLVTLSLLWSTGQKMDAWIFLLFNFQGKRPRWLDWTMLGFTLLGTGVASILAALVLFWVNDHHLAYELTLGTLTLWLVVELMKATIRRPRPYLKLTQTRVVGPRARGRSFPSGHTSQIFFTVTLLIQHFHLPIWGVILLCLLAPFVAITRMYVGAHYPRDLLAGMILGSVWGGLGIIIDAYFWEGLTHLLPFR